MLTKGAYMYGDLNCNAQTHIPFITESGIVLNQTYFETEKKE